jgi:hypothetical protein
MKGRLEHCAASLGGFGNGPHQIGGNGETDAVGTAGAAEYCGVDADQTTVHVDQSAAGIAGIDRGIGLDEGAEIRHADAVAGKCGNNAAGHGLTDAEGVADGQNDVAHFNQVCVAKFDDRKRPIAFDLQDREVEALILEQDTALKLAPVGKRHTNIIGAFDDVVVGHDDAVLLNDDAGAEGGLLLGTVGHALAEKLFEERITTKRRHAALNQPVGIDIDDSGCRRLHKRREGLHHVRPRAGRFASNLVDRRGLASGGRLFRGLSNDAAKDLADAIGQ